MALLNLAPCVSMSPGGRAWWARPPRLLTQRRQLNHEPGNRTRSSPAHLYWEDRQTILVRYTDAVWKPRPAGLQNKALEQTRSAMVTAAAALAAQRRCWAGFEAREHA